MAKRSSNGAPKRLVIVESPTKARTISRFLGDGYKVLASMGHVRDLPANAKQAKELTGAPANLRFGIDLDGYKPFYIISPGKQKTVRELKAALKDADELFIATDEDREGEAIGWHVVEVLQPKVPVRRMAFHEITRSAIDRALEATRDIDSDLVEAQEARRVIDRLVGYELSPLLWKKIAPGLSAGRVQSVAVRLLVEREKQRLDFNAGAYWDLQATLGWQEQQAAGVQEFKATLHQLGGVRVASGRDFDDHSGRLKENLVDGRDVVLLDQARAAALAKELVGGRWTVASVESSERKRRPPEPFRTSTLQQEGSRKLGMSARDTMRVAQGLYERGLITYMRTDSTNLAGEALEGIHRTVVERYGQDYLQTEPRRAGKAAKGAQEAHEAIRPAGVEMKTAQELGLRDRDAALYDLIWQRTVASQMADARLRSVVAQIEAVAGEQLAGFRATGQTTVFPGFLRAYVEGSDDPDAALDAREQPLPPLGEGDPLRAVSLQEQGHETKPPPRYTEASLVKTLEDEGIGRPSTYASIIDTIQVRQYARKQGSQLVPTFTAFATNSLLEAQFAQLVDTGFTARMEADLDEIAAGRQKRVPYVHALYAGENGIAERVKSGLATLDARALSTIEHAKWGDFKVRVGRYGPYAEGSIDGEVKTTSLRDDLAPADLTEAELETVLREGTAPDQSMGDHDPSGLPMLLKRGPYGPYLQLGDAVDGERPKRVSLPPGVSTDQVTQDLAQQLLDLPRQLGQHPESGEKIEAHIGRFGPYVKHRSTFASLPKGVELLEVDLPIALELLAKKERRNAPLRELGKDPASGDEVTVHEGRYGPYVKMGKVNATLGDGQDPLTIGLDEAMKLIDAKVAAGGGGRARKTTARKAVKKTAAKKPAAKRATKSAAKGATTKTKAAGKKTGPATKKPKAAGKAPTTRTRAVGDPGGTNAD